MTSAKVWGILLGMGRQRRQEPFQDQLRAAIDASPLSRYEICKRAGFSQATMSRFMNRLGSMSLPSVDLLVAVLNLELVPRKRRKGR